MNSFANGNVTSSDGRKNKEAVPDEIFARGFVPPVPTPDGSWQAGDELPANWLNWLLNDLYKGAVTQDRTPASQPANQQNYFCVQCGDVLIQGGFFVPSDVTTVAPRLMTYPTPFRSGSVPIAYGMRSQSQNVAAPFISSIDPPVAGDQSNSIMWTATLNGAAVATTPMWWVAIGHAAANSGGVPQGLRDLRTKLEFCEVAMTYPDGQENVGQPDTITVAQGFAPPVNNNGVWSEGDGLSAQALNFLLRDLYRMPHFEAIAGGQNRSGALEFAGGLIQWAFLNTSANAAAYNFAIPFSNGDPHVIAFDIQGYNASPAATEQCFAAVRDVTATGCNVFLTGGPVTSGNAVVKPAASVLVLAMGLSSRQSVPTGDDAQILDGFSRTPITYPDGQVNNVAPSAQQIANGFSFESAAGQGDFLSANKLNWLFNDLYKNLGFFIERTGAGRYKPPGYVNAFPQTTFRLGRLMIVAGRVRVGGLAGTGGKIIWRDPFKSPPVVMCTQRYDSAIPALGSPSAAHYMSGVAVTTTDATVQVRNAAGNPVTMPDNNTFDWVAFGLAPD